MDRLGVYLDRFGIDLERLGTDLERLGTDSVDKESLGLERVLIHQPDFGQVQVLNWEAETFSVNEKHKITLKFSGLRRLTIYVRPKFVNLGSITHIIVIKILNNGLYQ